MMRYLNNEATRRYVQEIGTVTVLFKDGRQATYTKSILAMLMTDDFIAEIMDDETGELLKVA